MSLGQWGSAPVAERAALDAATTYNVRHRDWPPQTNSKRTPRQILSALEEQCSVCMGDCSVGFGVAPHQHWPLQQQRRSGAQQHLLIVVESQSQAFTPCPSAFGSAHTRKVVSKPK
eukprot:COSAG01_NODE_380_length_17862_cov_20.427212_7_plen_116_part_00